MSDRPHIAIQCEIIGIAVKTRLDLCTGRLDLHSHLIDLWVSGTHLISLGFPGDPEVIAEGAGIMLVVWRLAHHRLGAKVASRYYDDSIRVLKLVGASDSYLQSIGFR